MVLVLGSGGREHAIVHQLTKSNKIDEVIITPGNGGTDTMKVNDKKITTVNLDLSDIPSLVSYAKEHSVNLVVVGPEQPLVDGVVDAMSAVVSFYPTFSLDSTNLHLLPHSYHILPTAYHIPHRASHVSAPTLKPPRSRRPRHGPRTLWLDMVYQLLVIVTLQMQRRLLRIWKLTNRLAM